MTLLQGKQFLKFCQVISCWAHTHNLFCYLLHFFLPVSLSLFFILTLCVTFPLPFLLFSSSIFFLLSSSRTLSLFPFLLLFLLLSASLFSCSLPFLSALLHLKYPSSLLSLPILIYLSLAFLLLFFPRLSSLFISFSFSLTCIFSPSILPFFFFLSHFNSLPFHPLRPLLVSLSLTFFFPNYNYFSPSLLSLSFLSTHSSFIPLPIGLPEGSFAQRRREGV